VALWTRHVTANSGTKPGDLSPVVLLGPDAANGLKALEACQQDYMAQLFADVVSFAGVFWGCGDTARSCLQLAGTRRGAHNLFHWAPCLR
jgi:hypothetical protein